MRIFSVTFSSLRKMHCVPPKYFSSRWQCSSRLVQKVLSGLIFCGKQGDGTIQCAGVHIDKAQLGCHFSGDAALSRSRRTVNGDVDRFHKYLQTPLCIQNLQIFELKIICHGNAGAVRRGKGDLQIKAAGYSRPDPGSAPAKYSPSQRLDAIVLASTSLTETPPRVMIASSMGRNARTWSETALMQPPRVSRCALVSVLALVSGAMPHSRSTGRISFAGSRAWRMFPRSRLGLSARSRWMRLSSCSGVRPGFRSISSR